jgi:arabinose-5-phosphate isomerase
LEKKFIDSSATHADTILSRGREVVRIEADALTLLAQCLDDNFVAACQLILSAQRRVVVTGMGKSGHVGRKIAATFAATGTPAIYVHPAEAGHGDLGMLTKGDVLVAVSNSGNTVELRPILAHARRLGLRIVGMATRPTSLVMDYADIPLCLPPAREACAANVAPTTSTTLQMALGDALAMAVMDLRGVTKDSLRLLHPSGSIGLRLTPVSEIMHGPERLPLVDGSAPMRDVISAMTAGSFGIAGVMDGDNRLCGVITDGDLRRHFDKLLEATAAEIMTPNPKTLPARMMAEDALLFLNDSEITAAFVMENDASSSSAVPIGIVHIHDFLRFGLN